MPICPFSFTTKACIRVRVTCSFCKSRKKRINKYQILLSWSNTCVHVYTNLLDQVDEMFDQEGDDKQHEAHHRDCPCWRLFQSPLLIVLRHQFTTTTVAKTLFPCTVFRFVCEYICTQTIRGSAGLKADNEIREGNVKNEIKWREGCGKLHAMYVHGEGEGSKHGKVRWNTTGEKFKVWLFGQAKLLVSNDEWAYVPSEAPLDIVLFVRVDFFHGLFGNKLKWFTNQLSETIILAIFHPVYGFFSWVMCVRFRVNSLPFSHDASMFSARVIINYWARRFSSFFFKEIDKLLAAKE